MLQLGGRISSDEQRMAAIVRGVLARGNFAAVTAVDVRRTSDFLHKIIDLIRGCGFSIAIFSGQTPAPTLANIFFEIGIAGVLGKPVQLVWSGTKRGGTVTPSDFVRTEWIQYSPTAEARFEDEISDAVREIEQGATGFYRKIGEVALEAVEPDLELAFERFKQAVLISNDRDAVEKITEIRDRLGTSARQHRADPEDDMASHRNRLLQAVNEFLRLMPK
jgi:hypothetical protein